MAVTFNPFTGNLDFTGSSSGTNLSYTASTRLLESSTGDDVTLPLFATNSTNAGLVPGSSTGGTTNFLRADGTWAAPPSGGGGGTKSLNNWDALSNHPPATNFATLDTRNSIAVLEFDSSVEESSAFIGVIPEGANLSSGILVRLWWMGDTATSGTVRWAAQFERSGTDLDSDSFDTSTEANGTANSTSGIETVTQITCTSIDSLSAGDRFRLKVSRKAADVVNDTMLGDAQLVAVEIRQVA